MMIEKMIYDGAEEEVRDDILMVMVVKMMMKMLR